MYIEKMANDEANYRFLLETMVKNSKGLSAKTGDYSNGKRLHVSEWVRHFDGKMYAKVTTCDGRIFYSNDYNAYAKLGRRMNDEKRFTEDEIKIIDRNYTKYMLWLNLENRQDYCDNYIRNQISLNKENLQKLNLAARKRATAKIKIFTQSYLDDLTKEIVDDVLFCTFFNGNVNKFGHKGIMRDAHSVYTLEQQNFFDTHTGYMRRLVDDTMLTECSKTYYEGRRQVNFADRVRKDAKMAEIHHQKVTQAIENHGLYAFFDSRTSHYDAEQANNLLQNTAELTNLMHVPFESYVAAYSHIYGDKSAEAMQQKE